MKYVCLVYNEPDKLEALTERERIDHVEACGEWVGDLIAGNRHVYSAGFQPPNTGAIVRVRSGAVSVTDGPCTVAKESLGGIVVFEARDLNEAIRLVSNLDAARIGAVEVRPLLDGSG